MCCLCLTIACIPVGVVWWYTADVLVVVADISPKSVYFTRICSRLSILWLWARIMFQIESVFFQAQQIVLPSAVFSMLAVVLNVFLSVSLVYGIPSIGFAGIGFIGCPIAMIITQHARLFAYTLYMTS
ncbi:Multidrug/Oligosaccharidyl-lipid/Polysaccharide (MOP) Flippase Superfamily [Thraustotheca clavata]|uniref:Multidrug/Oligosaccharidyl-lipid/Polysaccharide (MOP) Flippase Superfamily n=1 Tax=Thraustotheca clavata TaxID=74557 RepID=A0A1V9ZHA4_9STRA|nr:Multidrug/Oligosaccharidyl-lipid/Polysaccharide (MOP) Flippase Superfamily [Thraustotheca clavata]